jgi:geranylgeranyl pyrophosphate synthase
LPVIACTVAGGQAEQVLPVAASWVLFILAGRIFDDLADGEEDNREVFTGCNAPTVISACLFAVSTANAALVHLDDATAHSAIATAFSHALALAVKSENNQPPLSQLSVEAYFETIAAKTGLVFATGAWAGGRVATDDKSVLDALHQYGLHLGMMTQILDDCADLKIDLANQVWTLPLIYALTQEDHPLYERLSKLFVQQHQTPLWEDEVTAVITEMDAVSWCLQIAEAHRQQAINIIETLPCRRDLLSYYVTPKNK